MSIATDVVPATGEALDPVRPASTYDAVPYSVCAFPQTRPDRLAATAMLFGMRPAPPDACRVLELGCASGGNLIPLALAHPNSQLVGIDLSERQVEEGRRVADQLNLSNLDLRAISILDLEPDVGVFDYILVHGVYSWVPPEVQAAILDLCSRQLAPHGVAYISYNAYPGWHARGAIREMLWYHTRLIDDPAERIRAARTFITFLADATAKTASAPSSGSPFVPGGYVALIRQELALLRLVPDSYLLHEHLEEFNQPLYFHQFIQQAAQHGLQYLAEASVGTMMPERFGPQIAQTLRQISPDQLHLEQHMDFLRNQMFRQTLLCHAEVELATGLQPSAIKRLYVASAAKPVAEHVRFDSQESEEFRAPGNLSLHSSDPLMKAAMACLAENRSVPVPFAELLRTASEKLATSDATEVDTSAEALSMHLLHGLVNGLIELTASPPSYTGVLSDRPVASPYARLRAKEGGKIVNFRLERIAMGTPSRLVLTHLDGQHDIDSLSEIVRNWIRSELASRKQNPVDSHTLEHRPAEYVRVLLEGFTRHALLCR